MENKKTALVTGGTSGLGNAIVKLLLERGWNVATCGRRGALIEALLAENDKDSLLAVTCDIRLGNQVENLVGKTKEKFGRIDLCVLNAGTIGPVPLPEVKDLKLIDLRATFESNFFANFNIISQVLPLLSKSSLVVHVTSDAAFNSYPGWGAYSSSKSAMDKLISTLNTEQGESGIRSLSFDPGDMDTEMHALALPDADKSELKSPEQSAAELLQLVEKQLEVQ